MMNELPFSITVVVGVPVIFITGTFSAYEPAIPLMALNSPTPKVVIRAPIPFIRAYPSAAYAAFNSLQLPIHS